MKKILFIILAAMAAAAPAGAQMKWFDPVSEGPVMHGVGWDELKSGYFRLPERAKGVVREQVWDLSRHDAGLSLVFTSDAEEIIVLYTVDGGYSSYHMPSTGKTGIDLYATGRDGRLRWVAPDFSASFRDTIRYIYSGITRTPETGPVYEFHLYLPTYNHVEWMKIGIPESASITFLPETRQHPVVIYGTSITQGACCSRPGNCWTGIVERELELPVVNLGFSGNGKLDPEVLELMTEIDASAYIIDCTANLTHATDITPRLIRAIEILRSKRNCPILIAEHAGNTGEYASEPKRQPYKANAQVRAAYDSLLVRGFSDLYYVSKEELALPMDGMVEGVHPNDLGMRFLADAFERKIVEMGVAGKPNN